MTSAVALLHSMPPAFGQEITLKARSTDAAHSIQVGRNLPILLVIIFGSLTLLTMFVTALACLFRSSSSRSGSKSERSSFAEGVEGGDSRKRNTWSPGGLDNTSVFALTYSGESMDGSRDSLMIAKEGKGSSRKGSAFMSPVSPMPALKDHDRFDEKGSNMFYSLPGVNRGQPINVPSPVAMSPRVRGNGWQLYDNPVPHSGIVGGDVEAAGLLPSRRPSFIDRLLAHRADPNDARLPNGPDSPAVPRIPSSRKVSGSAILSALNPLRSRDNSQKRMTAVESDFEGSIGGRDGEIPMAKRHNQGRFAFDEVTVAAASPAVHRQSIDRFSPLPPRFFSGRQGSTPHTPGLAGVGATWNQDETTLSKDNHGRVPTFAELQRIAVCPADANRWKMQTTIDEWVQGSRFAGRPPPSRKGSSASFLTAGGISQVTRSVSQRETGEVGLDRVPSLRPHFAATTTLASWLDKDQKVIDEQSEGEEAKDQVKGEVPSMDRPPSYHSQKMRLPSSSSIDGTMGHAIDANLKIMRESEEERSRQKQLAKDQRRAEKRAVRQQQSEEAAIRRSIIMEQRKDYIQSMNASREQHHHLDPDEIVAQSRRSSTKIINFPSHRSANRMMSPMSPPESPLTSASEGPCRTPRRRSEHFLVPSSRSRSSVYSGSMRSVSHSVVSMQRPNVPPVDLRKQSLNLQPVSERPLSM
jgi:hypothetical protein